MIAPDAYLVLAEKLLLGVSEEDWRTAVSRGYYAAFHSASEFMSGLGFSVPPSELAHKYLSFRLSNSGHPPLDAAGTDLDVLRADRNFADYVFQRDLSQADARIQVQAAREIMEVIDDCAVEPIRTQVRDAIRDYERNVLCAVTWQGP
jgi:hypothetical protein